MPTITLNRDIQFLQRTWAEECVVYVVNSGETHILSSPCVLLLDLLHDGPASFEALKGEFQPLADDLDPAELSNLLISVIESVRKIGLIETTETLS